MANVTKTKREIVRQSILKAAARCFLEQGFTNTTVKHIAAGAGIHSGSFTSHFRTKEDVLCELVSFVLNQQFSTARKLTEGKTEDPLMLYAAETVLQLHIVEMSEALRDVYCAAYSLPKTSALLQQMVTGKVESIFKQYLPELETKDFYKLEIATGGIMRGFMTVPCNMWFTIDQKVASFLGCTFKMYDIPAETIQEAITFVGQFDFAQIARDTIASILHSLEAPPGQM